MKEYKRLTKEKGFHKDIDLTQELGYSYIYQRLAELENKIENRTLIELPCKVGDTVYIATRVWDIKEVVEAKVEGIEFSITRNKKDFIFYLDHKYVFSKHNPNKVEGRYIFWEDEFYLTREEAEAKMKELQEKDNEI